MMDAENTGPQAVGTSRMFFLSESSLSLIFHEPGLDIDKPFTFIYIINQRSIFCVPIQYWGFISCLHQLYTPSESR